MYRIILLTDLETYKHFSKIILISKVVVLSDANVDEKEREREREREAVAVFE